MIQKPKYLLTLASENQNNISNIEWIWVNIQVPKDKDKKTTRNTLVTETLKLFKANTDHVVLNPAPWLFGGNI